MTELVDPRAVAYAEAHTTAADGPLAAVAAWTAEHTSAPQMMGGPAEARLLEALIVAGGATRVLEIGTFTGFSALTMAAALPEGGRVTTIEVDEEIAAAARRHLAEHPAGARVDLLVGDARELLAGLPGPFDLVWIDAWKSDYPAYLEAVLPKLAPRGMLVADNLFRGGDVLEPGAGADESTRGLRAFAAHVHGDPRLHNVLLTIGDGVLLAWPAPQRA
jgi:caffeoyl-CoA O-methyltransferase